MKGNVKILIMFVICMYYGCKKNTTTDNIFFLDLKIKKEAKCVKIDTVGFYEDLILSKRFFVYQDTVLIVQNRKYEDVFFIEFYNLSRQQLFRQLFRLGNGPNEMLSANAIVNGNMLIVNDYVKSQVSFVNIDSVLNNPQYNTTVIRHYCDSPTAIRYKEEQLLLINPNCFKSKELGIDQKASRFIIATDNVPYLENRSYKYYTRNVAVHGVIISNFQQDRIFYVNGNIPFIELYNSELELIRQIHGPDKLIAKYRIDNGNSICFNKVIPYAYMCFCTSINYIYLTYIGDNHIPMQNNVEDLPTWIFKFDWDGNLIESYSVGRYINSISLSLDEKSIYATAINEEKNPFLIKLSLYENQD